MKNKKAVKLLATINVLAMLTMLGQPVVKAQQPKEEYLVEIMKLISLIIYLEDI